jgi:putative tryptophan/tyrosine transport system substrate-binding protein
LSLDKNTEIFLQLGGHETTRIHHPSWRRGSVAAGITGAAANACSSADGYAPMVAAFGQGLKEIGYVDGQNVVIEYRWAEGRYDQPSELVADLIRRQVSVIAATSTPANLVAKKATSTIPIVFTTSSDPVQLGLVESLNRPGANVTGVTQLNVEVGPKRLELAAN